jgi:hypothetical protein
MANQVTESVKQLNYYRKKRNLILFFTLMPPPLFLLIWAMLQYVLMVDSNILLSIYIPIILGYLIYVNIFRSKLAYYVMYYNYYHMLTYQEGLQDVSGTLFTKSWLAQFETDGFKKTADTKDYMIFQQFYAKLKTITNSGHVMVSMIIAKHGEVDFYDEKIQKQIDDELNLYEDYKKVKKQIFIQFKRYNELDEVAQHEITQIVNYKHDNQYLIHMNVGYSYDEKKAYFLCPKKRYPNKYYYYTCQQVKKYCKIKVND